jgi:hypothetical protein
LSRRCLIQPATVVSLAWKSPRAGAVGLREALSLYGASDLVIVGGLAVAATLIASPGLRGFAVGRFGLSLLPVGYRVRHPRG